MSIEQRRAKALNKKKLSKVQKALKNKAAEFKRKDDLLRLIMAIISGRKFGANLEQITSSLQADNGIEISAREIEILLLPDLLKGRLLRLAKGESGSPRSITYRLNRI
jgi:hypothetical protein